MTNTILQTPPRPGLHIVVGGSGAIGQGIVAALLAQSADVVVLDRAMVPGSSVPFIETDITDAAMVTAALAQIDRMGRPVEALFLAAGLLQAKPFMSLTEKDLITHHNVNVLGAFRMAQGVAKRMHKAGGRIVFVTSIHARIGVPDRAAYAMSKAAVEAMVRAMAVELSEFGIRVNALAPGAVDGGMAASAHTRTAWQDATPAHRVAMIDEVASFALLLASPEASFLSGQTIALDGGASNLRPITRPLHSGGVG